MLTVHSVLGVLWDGVRLGHVVVVCELWIYDKMRKRQKEIAAELLKNLKMESNDEVYKAIEEGQFSSIRAIEKFVMKIYIDKIVREAA